MNKTLISRTIIIVEDKKGNIIEYFTEASEDWYRCNIPRSTSMLTCDKKDSLRMYRNDKRKLERIVNMVGGYITTTKSEKITPKKNNGRKRNLII